ncbi:MAG: hypothetical protein KDB88_06075 [Flavobacteriales bacterium]|nr:hypothetical protein [Flavobacteriales bacterium]
MSALPPQHSMDPLQASLVRTLAYFDLFDHPLDRDELLGFLDRSASDEALGLALNELRDQGLLQEDQGYFALRDPSALLNGRIADEARAQKAMDKAMRNARLIGRFPFVQAVFLSGSMSKGRLSDTGDVDYFVITEPGRLWIARTLLMLYKKVFLLNSRRFFCVNYFIDSDHLLIEDRNRFTATELITLMPASGNGLCDRLFEANPWAFELFPNAKVPSGAKDAGPGRITRSLRHWLSGPFGAGLDRLFMRLTFNRWKRRFGDMGAKDFEIAFRTRSYVSKHHPNHFQHRVLQAHRERIRAVQEKHERVIAGP